MPRVVVYSNGDVVFADGTAEARYWGIRYKYKKVRLTPLRLHELLEFWKPLKAVPHHGFAVVNEFAHTASAIFWINQNSLTKAFAVRGFDCEFPRNWTKVDLSAAHLPDGVQRLHKSMCELQYPVASDWIPQQVEVKLRQHLGASTDAVDWPASWPDARSSSVKRVFRGFSVTLNGTELAKLKELVGDAEQYRKIRFGGKIWSIDYREEFPGEQIWRNDLSGKN